MNRPEHFKTRLEATIAPVEVLKLLKAHPENIRVGPQWAAKLLGDRMPGALQILQNDFAAIWHPRKDRTVILHCWDTSCSLAAEAAVPLLERGVDVREMTAARSMDRR